MASSSHLRSKSQHHSRSLSLPCPSHPLTSQFSEALSKIKTSKGSPPSLSSFINRINGVKSLYSGIDDLLLLPNIQQEIISQESENKWIDQALDGHIRLLDACSTARDLFSEIKLNIQDLLSGLRRKDVHAVQNYLYSRKKLQKMIQKVLKALRVTKTVTFPTLKEAEMATLCLFESLLSYVMGAKTQSRQGGWPSVSNFVLPKKVLQQLEESYLNEFQKMDYLLTTQKHDIELMNHLNEMEMSIQVLEDELECFFRQLIRTRVSLLNNLN